MKAPAQNSSSANGKGLFIMDMWQFCPCPELAKDALKPLTVPKQVVTGAQDTSKSADWGRGYAKCCKMGCGTKHTPSFNEAMAKCPILFYIL